MTAFNHPPSTERVESSRARFQQDTVNDVRTALSDHDVVVVGMGWNPHCRRARTALGSAGVAFHYLEFGNYLSGWRPRLAIKLWSRWPTFPQVFVKGTLIGGADQTVKMLESGELTQLIAADPV
jgi:glutaredoxin-related protein